MRTHTFTQFISFFLFFVCCGPNGREVSYLSKLGLPLAWQPSFPPRLSLDKMSIAVSSSIIAVPSGISQTPFAFTNKVFFKPVSRYELLLVWSGLVNENHPNFQVDMAICPYIGKIYMKHVKFVCFFFSRKNAENWRRTGLPNKSFRHKSNCNTSSSLFGLLLVGLLLIIFAPANCPHFPFTNFFYGNLPTSAALSSLELKILAETTAKTVGAPYHRRWSCSVMQ